MNTSEPGKSRSGSFCTSMRTNEISPARVRATNRTIGGIGLRIDQAEMLRNFMARPSARGLLPDRSDLLARPADAAGGLHDPLGSVQAFDAGDNLVGDLSRRAGPPNQGAALVVHKDIIAMVFA